jgi:hypothetical protein
MSALGHTRQAAAHPQSQLRPLQRYDFRCAEFAGHAFDPARREFGKPATKPAAATALQAGAMCFGATSFVNAAPTQTETAAPEKLQDRQGAIL